MKSFSLYLVLSLALGMSSTEIFPMFFGYGPKPKLDQETFISTFREACERSGKSDGEVKVERAVDMELIKNPKGSDYALKTYYYYPLMKHYYDDHPIRFITSFFRKPDFSRKLSVAYRTGDNRGSRVYIDDDTSCTTKYKRTGLGGSGYLDLACMECKTRLTKEQFTKLHKKT